MAGVAVMTGTSAVQGGIILEFGFWIDGVNLSRYIETESVVIEMESSANDNSRASFTLVNHDGTLDFGDFWGVRHGETPLSYVAFPLREVRFHDHATDEPLFGGYVTGITMRPYPPNKSAIVVTCVGYSMVLDASILSQDLTIPLGTTGYTAVQSCVQAAGLRGGAQADAGLWSDDPDIGAGIDNFMGTVRWNITISAGTTLRQAIMQVSGAGASPVAVYVDNYKRLCVVSNSGAVLAENAPGTPYGPTLATDQPTEGIELTMDFSEYANRILMTGSNLPAGGLWFEGRMTGTFPNIGAQQFTTYNPPFDVDMTESTDVDTTYVEDVAFSRLGTRQAPAIPAYRFTVRGFTGWRLMQLLQVKFPQFLGAGGTAHQLNVTAYRMRFQMAPEAASHADQFVVDVTARDPFEWAVGGWNTAISSVATTAQYTKQRLTRRTS